MNQTITMFMTVMLLTALSSLELKADQIAQSYNVPSPWYPLTKCNQEDFKVEFQIFRPPGHQFTEQAREEFRMVLQGKVAQQAAATDSRVRDMVNSQNGTLAISLNTYDAIGKLSLCKTDENCSQGPILNFDLSKSSGELHLRTLKFYMGTVGGMTQVGQDVILNCNN